MADVHPVMNDDNKAVQRKLSSSSSSDAAEKAGVERADEGPQESTLNRKLRVAFLIGLAALILGWWISATVLKATRDRWQVWRSQNFPCILKSTTGLYKRSSLGSS